MSVAEYTSGAALLSESPEDLILMELYPVSFFGLASVLGAIAPLLILTAAASFHVPLSMILQTTKSQSTTKPLRLSKFVSSECQAAHFEISSPFWDPSPSSFSANAGDGAVWDLTSL
ncbi:hypothetical protein DL96DRAFT_1719034 [Flagelloscypha sp. PMI_526]|nr:hypothetical protein DL96DRAFT_1719034 [Flagelloscypha sp. PMI_526]